MHKGRVNDLSFDKEAEHLASASQDCSVAVSGRNGFGCVPCERSSSTHSAEWGGCVGGRQLGSIGSRKVGQGKRGHCRPEPTEARTRQKKTRKGAWDDALACVLCHEHGLHYCGWPCEGVSFLATADHQPVLRHHHAARVPAARQGTVEPVRQQLYHALWFSVVQVGLCGCYMVGQQSRGDSCPSAIRVWPVRARQSGARGGCCSGGPRCYKRLLSRVTCT